MTKDFYLSTFSAIVRHAIPNHEDSEKSIKFAEYGHEIGRCRPGFQCDAVSRHADVRQRPEWPVCLGQHRGFTVVTEREIFNCLKSKFPAESYALLPQVRSTTGTGAARTADALAVGLWPSRGHYVHGFEFKDSRRDWLSELKKPAKADEIAAKCDYWHIVFSDEKHFKTDEVPVPWGILVCNSGGVAEVRKPERNAEPKPPTWAFLAAVLRRAAAVAAGEDEVAAAVRKAVSDAQDASYKEMQAARKKYQEDGRREYCELMAKVTAFEDASGVKIAAQWMREGKIGEAVKLVLDGGLDAKIAMIETMRENCDRISRTLAAVVGEIRPRKEQGNPASHG